jgi:hypothetical protein
MRMNSTCIATLSVFQKQQQQIGHALQVSPTLPRFFALATTSTQPAYPHRHTRCSDSRINSPPRAKRREGQKEGKEGRSNRTRSRKRERAPLQILPVYLQQFSLARFLSPILTPCIVGMQCPRHLLIDKLVPEMTLLVLLHLVQLRLPCKK